MPENDDKKKMRILLLIGILFFLSIMLIFIFLVISINLFETLECGVETHSLHLYIISLGILLLGYILYLNDLFL